MATYSSIFPPAAAKPVKLTALSGSSAELVYPKSRIIAIQPIGGTAWITFGNTGSTSAGDATGWPIGAGAVYQFDMSDQWTAFRIFTAGAVDVYILEQFRS